MLSCSLLNLKKDLWGDKVTVIASDMRDWKPENKADIIVSELLGSFGCNELSPECLYGAQNLLKGNFYTVKNLKILKILKLKMME